VQLNYVAVKRFHLNDPAVTIARLKCDDETKEINLLAHVSRVQADLKKAAQEKGCDVVIARSAFSHNLRRCWGATRGGNAAHH